MQPLLSNLLRNLNNDDGEIDHLHQQRIGLNQLAVSSRLDVGQQCANGFLQNPTLLADQLPADEDIGFTLIFVQCLPSMKQHRQMLKPEKDLKTTATYLS